MQIKRFFIASVLFICLSLVFVFAGCGNQDSSNGDEDTRVYWGTLVGTVTEYGESPVSALPVAGIAVKSGNETAVTDENGVYEIKVYNNGATVSFEKDGYITQKKTFKSSSFSKEQAEYNFIMYISATVHGSVKDGSGNLLSGAVVSVGIQQTLTNADGSFVFEEVIGTDMVIVATYNGKTVRKAVYADEMCTGSVTVELVID